MLVSRSDSNQIRRLTPARISPRNTAAAVLQQCYALQTLYTYTDTQKIDSRYAGFHFLKRGLLLVSAAGSPVALAQLKLGEPPINIHQALGSVQCGVYAIDSSAKGKARQTRAQSAIFVATAVAPLLTAVYT